MKKISRLTALIAVIVGLTPATDCSLLSQPKTILLVQASWCGSCQKFVPIYEKLSNDSNYKDWIFYTTEDDNFSSICGAYVPYVPAIYVNNLQLLKGASRNGVLAKYLDDHNKNSTPSKNICVK